MFSTRIRRVLIASAASAALLAGSGLTATGAFAAGSPTVNAKANLYANNAICDGASDTTQPQEGFLIVHRTDATTVSINYHLENAQPNQEYTVTLYEAPCTPIALLGTVTTDASGTGNANFKDVTIPAATAKVFTFSTTFSPNFQEVESQLADISS